MFQGCDGDVGRVLRDVIASMARALALVSLLIVVEACGTPMVTSSSLPMQSQELRRSLLQAAEAEEPGGRIALGEVLGKGWTATTVLPGNETNWNAENALGFRFDIESLSGNLTARDSVFVLEDQNSLLAWFAVHEDELGTACTRGTYYAGDEPAFWVVNQAGAPALWPSPLGCVPGL